MGKVYEIVDYVRNILKMLYYSDGIPIYWGMLVYSSSQLEPMTDFSWQHTVRLTQSRVLE